MVLRSLNFFNLNLESNRNALFNSSEQTGKLSNLDKVKWISMSQGEWGLAGVCV